MEMRTRRSPWRPRGTAIATPRSTTSTPFGTRVTRREATQSQEPMRSPCSAVARGERRRSRAQPLGGFHIDRMMSFASPVNTLSYYPTAKDCRSRDARRLTPDGSRPSHLCRRSGMKIRAKTTTAIIAMLTLMSAAVACSSPSKSASTPGTRRRRRPLDHRRRGRKAMVAG